MESFMGLTFERFVESDILKLSDIMKRAFDEDTRIHLGQNSGGPPGYDNGDFMREWYLHEGVSAFTISKDGTYIGAIALWINQNNENYLGNMFLDPDYQNKGLGTVVWKYVEQKYPDTEKWKTLCKLHRSVSP
ncbi:MAG: GNAT family N-acetyltransferase [Clostridiales bacterium]|jgi:GNAT superfamily N-acetyltransferase|nr:GNAT family N-acetyltransferase [Clostridiales bacterium]